MGRIRYQGGSKPGRESLSAGSDSPAFHIKKQTKKDQRMKVIIIGGVAGGATAAARLRRLDEEAEIIVIEKSGYISYANCGLPYYIGGVIREKSALTLQTPESFRARFRIDARVSSEALRIDRKKKEVLIRDNRTGREYSESYDKLILSPGAEAIVPPFPGVNDRRIFTLRHTEDAFAIREYAEKNKNGNAVVIGGGFIGLETAENLRHMGVGVTLIQLTDHVMSTFDRDMAEPLHAELRKNGVDLHLGTAVEAFSDKDGKLEVITSKGSFTADFVVLAIGVRPDSSLASECGLETDSRGSIITDSSMRTSDPDIYAAGDAVSVRNTASGQMGMAALAGPANREGRTAADSIAGIESRFRGTSAASILKCFSLTAASAGLSEESAARAGIPCECIVAYPGSHAGYYPGAEGILIKVLYEKGTGRILGAEAVGREGTDKFIEKMSMAVSLGLIGDDLASLDPAYAPPFSSAKDPVNIAGYIIGNRERGILEEFSYKDIPSLDMNKSMLVDLRTEAETANGMIEGAVSIPLDSLRENLGKLDRTKTIYVYCRSGQRSYIGMRILKANGFRAKSLSGGYLFYTIATGGRAGGTVV